jgi:hypothetical protein
MPWEVLPVSEVRFAFVHQVVSLQMPVAEACRKFRVSPSQKTRQVADCFGVVGSNFNGSSVEPFGLVVVLPTVAHVNG